MKMLKSIFQQKGAYLLLAFLLINLICNQFAGNNPNSRFALLRTITQKASFTITPLIKQENKFWTDDWSQTPDGQYYSNKPPGAAFVATPVFLFFDSFSKLTWNKKHDWFTTPPTQNTRKMTSLITQVVFFVFLFGFLYHKKKLAPELYQPIPFISFLVLFCFANTSSNYMNTFMGHGLAAVLTFWFVNSLLTKNYIHLGLSFGFGLLNDYSFAFFIAPAIAFILYNNSKKIGSIKRFIIGGIPAGLLWVWYHWVNFGSPLSIATKYQNPKYLDVTAQDNIGGVFSTSINFDIVYELFFGVRRGLLITQPWIIVAIILIFVSLRSKFFNSEQKLFFGFNLFVFSLLLIMNSSFGGWHGGSGFGPRYLAIIFPWFAFSVSIILGNKLNKLLSTVLILTTIWSICFYSLVYSTYLLSDAQNVLLDLFHFFGSENPVKSTIRFLFCLLLIGGGIYLELRKFNPQKDNSLQ
jgi:hypothetical protein